MDEEQDELFTPQEFLADARKDFAEYYATATPADTMLLDGLVMAHAALVVGYNSLLTETDPGGRAELERKCVEAEQVFSRFREQVRACATYRCGSNRERFALEQVLLNVRAPDG